MSTGTTAAATFAISAVLSFLAWLGIRTFDLTSDGITEWIVFETHVFFLAAAVLGPLIYVALLHSTRPWLITLLALGAILVVAANWYSYLTQDIAFPGYGVVFYPAAGLVAGAAINLVNRRPRS